MTAGIGRWASWNVRRVRRHGSAGADTAIDASTPGSVAVATSVPAPPIEWPRRATLVTSGRAWSQATPARASAAYSPTDIGRTSGPFAPCPRTSSVSTW